MNKKVTKQFRVEFRIGGAKNFKEFEEFADMLLFVQKMKKRGIECIMFSTPLC